jgi:hypothetical protein
MEELNPTKLAAELGAVSVYLSPTPLSARLHVDGVVSLSKYSPRWLSPAAYGFQIVEPTHNWVLAGKKFDLTTADVIEFCRNYERQRRVAFELRRRAASLRPTHQSSIAWKEIE